MSQQEIMEAELELNKAHRRGRLAERARGRPIFSWLDLAFLVPIGVLGCLNLSSIEKLPIGTIAAYNSLVLLIAWVNVRLRARIDALTSWVLDSEK